MWKCVSKSIKVLLDKNRFKCCNVPATKVTQKCKADKVLVPTLCERLNRYYDFFKSCCGEESSDNKQRKDRRAKRGFSFGCMQNKWIEALSLSIVVGWYCILPYKRFLCPIDLNNQKSTKYLENTNEYFNTKQWGNTLSNIFLPNPVCYVLPEVSAVKKKSDAKNNLPEEINPEVLEEAHEKVVGSLSNWLGTECMQTGNHKEAVKHFEDAAEVNNAAAFFNLGICHEMGLGTEQSFKKAAAMYKKASDLGHATAMYNLGVFYVHGWGGLEADSDTARQLFKAAASLGQADARKLLHMENEPPVNLPLGDSVDPQPSTSSGSRSTTGNSLSVSLDIPLRTELKSDSLHQKIVKEVDPKITDPTFLWYHVLNIPVDDIRSENFHSKKFEQIGSVDSGVLDLSSEDELNIFV